MKLVILLATYNSEKYLEEQLLSLYRQTYLNWELYVRDDGSIDNTLAIITKFQSFYSNLHLLESDTGYSLGPQMSFMKLLSSVVADYYMFCDHDDIWLDNKVEVTLRKMQEIQNENPEKPIIVHTDLTVVDSNLNIISKSFWNYSCIPIHSIKKFEHFIACNPITGCTMMFNYKVKELAFPISRNSTMHDRWLGFVTVTNNGIIYPLEEQTILYRQHGKNSVGAKSYNRALLIEKCKYIFTTTKNNYKIMKMANDCKRINLLSFFYSKIYIFLNRIK